MRNAAEKFKEIYENAVYAVEYGGEIRFAPGQPNGDLDRLLRETRAATFAFITACNPFSKKLSAEENTRRQKALINDITQGNYRFFFGYGADPSEKWIREESLFILNINKRDAREIARKYEQNAFLFGRLGRAVELVWSEV